MNKTTTRKALLSIVISALSLILLLGSLAFALNTNAQQLTSNSDSLDVSDEAVNHPNTSQPLEWCDELIESESDTEFKTDAVSEFTQDSEDVAETTDTPLIIDITVPEITDQPTDNPSVGCIFECPSVIIPDAVVDPRCDFGMPPIDCTSFYFGLFEDEVLSETQSDYNNQIGQITHEDGKVIGYYCPPPCPATGDNSDPICDDVPPVFCNLDCPGQPPLLCNRDCPIKNEDTKKEPTNYASISIDPTKDTIVIVINNLNSIYQDLLTSIAALGR